MDATKYESDRQLLNDELIFYRTSIFVKSHLNILENNKVIQIMNIYKVEKLE